MSKNVPDDDSAITNRQVMGSLIVGGAAVV
jgi:hypothetical protein